MLRILGRPSRLCDGVSRRDFLRVGGLGALGLGLPQLLAAESVAGQAKGRRKASACILFFLQGGQSQLETFDMKPAAPAEVRGEFRPIATRVPGTHVCEHLPRLAAVADRYALIRSMTHRSFNHNPASYYALSGLRQERDDFDIKAGPNDFPNPGAVAARFRPSEKPVPSFVQLSPPVVGDLSIQMPGQGAGLMGASYEPLKVTADPSRPGFGVEELGLPDDLSPDRIGRRLDLLGRLQGERPGPRDWPGTPRMDALYQRALGLVTSAEARRAFELGREPDRVRRRYGLHTQGQSLLLARRLVEAGVRLVTVYWGGPLNTPDDFWDTHKGNVTKQRDRLLPTFDECLSALLDDLGQRGLLETTLVVCMGEFGRTPRLGQATGDNGTDATGRDHWPYCYSILLAGGGVRGGAVVGRSDLHAGHPADRPVAPEDVTATIYHTLGIAEVAEWTDRLGRRLPVTRGEPVAELFS